jgi:UDP-N-acetylmuramoyl-tripeptide--D-alanyl-D-alanine ligase
MKIEKLYSVFQKSTGVCTDTRTLKKEQLFFALHGPNFNGNEFTEKALEAGAAFVVVDETSPFKENKRLIKVENTLATLQYLASYHRQKLNTPIIALTGSNGKTTTKELIRAVLSKKYNLLATHGNLNNHIGVPLTLLQLKKHHQLAIIEMGANHKNEIKSLCEIVQPNWGYITNFGKAHLEGFGSEQGVIEGKSELYHYLIKNNRQILINGDDPKQVELTKSFKVVQFGRKDLHEILIKPNNIIKGELELTFEGKTFKSALHGAYNLTNLAAAIAFGKLFEVPLKQIQEAVKVYQSDNNRSQKLMIKKTQIILDAYNANPSSMEVAIQAFKQNPKENKAVILGDMFELGSESQKEHENILQLCLDLEIETVFAIGTNFTKTQIEHPSLSKFETLTDFIHYLELREFNFEAVLIKGSRSMKLEDIIPFLKSK